MTVKRFTISASTDASTFLRGKQVHFCVIQVHALLERPLHAMSLVQPQRAKLFDTSR